MSLRHAVVNPETGIVENVVVWDTVSNWSPPAGRLLVQNDRVDMGDHIDPITLELTKRVVVAQDNPEDVGE